MRRQVQPNKIVVLGRGLEVTGEGDDTGFRPSKQTIHRAEAAGRFYLENRKLFTAAGALIVCSGGYPGSSKGMPKPKGVSEAEFMCDILEDVYQVPRRKLGLETNSSSTISNFEELLRAGFFEAEEFSADNPLGIVASRIHAPRASLVAVRAFDITPEDGIVRVPGAEEYDPRTLATELVGYHVTKHYLKDVTPGDVAQLHAADVAVTAFARKSPDEQLSESASWMRD